MIKLFRRYISIELFIYSLVLLYSLTYIFLPSFQYLPVHDTKVLLDSYYVFYNELLINHTIAFWNPYYLYGADENLAFIGFSYSQYFWAIIGWIFNIQNVLLLFNLSLSIEKFLFLLGIYLLSKKFFHHSWTRIFVGIGAILTIHEGVQLFFNFRIYSLVPFVIYFIYLFFEKLDIKYIVYVGIFVLFSFIGNPPYFPPFYFLLYFVVSIPLLVQNFKRFKRLQFKFSPIYWLYFIILFSLYFVYMDLLFHTFSEVSLQSNSREVDGKVSMTTFLTYAALPNFRSYFELIYAIPTSRDETFFIGHIPLVFFIYSLFFKINQKKHSSFYSMLVVLILFSISYSSFVAIFIYNYMPFMNTFRLISLIVPLIKIIILFISGFGIELYIKNKHTPEMKSLLLKTIFGFIITVIVLDLLVFRRTPYNISLYLPFNDYFYFHYLPLIVVMTLAFYLLNREDSIGMIVLFYFIEIMSYYSFVHAIYPTRMSKQETNSKTTLNEYKEEWTRMNSVYRIKNFDYKEQRMYIHDLHKFVPESYKNINSFPSGELYSHLYKLFYFDSCKQYHRYDFLPKSFNQLLRAKHGVGIDTEYVNISYIPFVDKFLDDYDFRNAIGCNTQKQYLIRNVEYANTKDIATKYIYNNQIHRRPVVLDEINYIPSSIKNQSNQNVFQEIPSINLDENLNFSLKTFQKNLIELPIQYYFPENLKYGDVNGDGLSDMVYADFGVQNRIFVNLNSANGFIGFQLWLNYQAEEYNNRSFFYLRDINSDQSVDIIINHLNSQNIAHIWTAISDKNKFIQTSKIDFSEKIDEWKATRNESKNETDYSMTYEDQIQFGDHDGDGLVDIYYTHYEKNSMQAQIYTIFLSRNLGNNRFARPILVYQQIGDHYTKNLALDERDKIIKKIINLRDSIDIKQIKLGDVNGDKKTDIVFYDAIEKKVFVNLSDGQIDNDLDSKQVSKNQKTWYVFLQNSVKGDHFFIADMNRDGRDDFIFIDSNGKLSIAESNNKEFQLNSQKSISLSIERFQQSQLKIIDINGDGLADIAYLDKNKLLYFIQNKSGFIAKEFVIDINNVFKPKMFDIVDLNKDIHKDIILKLNEVEILKFTANQIQMKVNVSEKNKGSWFVYLDNYHPAWKAKINGQEIPIHRVNLAFKGIYIEQSGICAIDFEFTGNHKNRLYVPILMGSSFLFSIGLIIYFLLNFFPYIPHSIDLFIKIIIKI